MFIFRLIKWIMLTGVFAAILVAALIAVYFHLDRIALEAIERGGGYATGVPTHLDSANLSLWRSELGLTRLAIENPEGFTAPSFLEMQTGTVAFDLRSFFRKRVVVPRINLEGLVLNLEERSGGSNYSVIMESINRLKRGPDDPPLVEKTYLIEEILIRDITVHAGTRRLAFLRPLTVTIEEIRLTDVGSDTENGLLLEQVKGVIIEAILNAVARNAAEILAIDTISLRESGSGPTSRVQGFKVEGLSTGDLLNAPLRGLERLFRGGESND